MTAAVDGRPRLLLVGGAGGLVGRALLPLFAPRYQIRSVHRYPATNEPPSIEWVKADVGAIGDWAPMLDDVQVVLNLAWYRWAPEGSFRALREGLLRLIAACVVARIGRVLQVSVPPAPASLENDLPYLRYKRQVDAALAGSGLSHRIVRPTMLFGPGDVLLGVMLRAIRRYPVFPMFGSGEYHVSPLAASDLARVLLQEAQGTDQGTLDLGGPERFTYRELTDLLFRAAGKAPHYWHMSGAGARRLTRLLAYFGSTVLYPYEVEWLMSDRLGLPPYAGLALPMQSVRTYLAHASP